MNIWLVLFVGHLTSAPRATGGETCAERLICSWWQIEERRARVNLCVQILARRTADGAICDPHVYKLDQIGAYVQCWEQCVRV